MVRLVYFVLIRFPFEKFGHHSCSLSHDYGVERVALNTICLKDVLRPRIRVGNKGRLQLIAL